MKINRSDLMDMDSNQTVIVVSIVAVVILAFGLAYSTKLFGDLMFKRDVYSDKREARETLESNVAKSEDLLENYELLEERGVLKEQILKAVPAELNFSEQATYLEIMAIRSGVALSSVSIEDDENEPIIPNPEESASQNSTPKEFTIIAEVNGGYSNFRRFVRSIEQSIRPYEIVAMDTSGESDVVIGEVHLKTYYVPYVNPKPTTKEVTDEE